MFRRRRRYLILLLPPNLRLPVLRGMRGQPFPNQIIPASLFDPNAVLYFQSSILPHANTLGDKATTSEATPTTVTEEVVRIDHEVNDKWQILGHFLHDSPGDRYGRRRSGLELGDV